MSLRSDPLREARDVVRSTITMHDALDLLGMEGPNKQGKIHSIYSDERTPSLHVYETDYFDYSTGQGGDVIRFVEDAAGVSFREAVEILSNGRSLTPLGRMPGPPKQVLDLTSEMEAARSNDTVTHADYERVDRWARKRWGLSASDLAAFGCCLMGADNDELWIPHRNPATGKVPGIRVRRVDSSDKWSYEGSTFTQTLYWPSSPRLKSPSRVEANAIVVVEGESDAWVLRKLLDGRQVDVAALPTGAGTWRQEYAEQLHPHSWIATILDGDEPGRKAAARIAETVNVDRDIVPPGGRLAEAVVKGWNPFPE